jgi:DNA-binding response OmpR family regulator
MKSYRVLVADDEPHARSGLRRTLKRDGFRVETATNGLEAAMWLRRERFDAVVADWKMPVIDGISLLRLAKGRDDQIVFVLMSAFATPDVVVEAMKAGSSDVIAKPFAPSDVERALHRGLARRARVDETPRRVYRCPSTHTWVWPSDDGSTVIGADAEFYEKTGELVYCDLPLEGEHFAKGERCVTATTSGDHVLFRIRSPIGCVVLETNGEMELRPWAVQGDPYGRGWLMRTAPTSLLPDLRGMTLEAVPIG